VTVSDSATTRRAAKATLARAVDRLISLQHPEGWWKGELQTNVTMEAEDLLMRAFLGILHDDIVAPTAEWIRGQQTGGGPWTTFHGGPGDLSTTVEAYTALRLAGDPPDAAHMRRACEFVRDAGGLEGARVFTRLWLALFGVCSWDDDVPALPPEIIFLPRWFPLNIYDWASWARQTLVPLTVVAAHRPVRPLGFSLDELRTGRTRREPAAPCTWPGVFDRLDRVLHAYERSPAPPVRRLAVRRCVEWILARQEADGCWGGIQPPLVYSILALRTVGYTLDHPVQRAALAAIDAFTVRDDEGRRMEACQSPVWDTALAVIALSDAGLDGSHPALAGAGSFLLRKEVRVTGDWAVRRPGAAPGGWSFEFSNANYPDIDDASEVVMALRRIGAPAGPEVDDAVARGVAWIDALQCADGGWAAFDVDNTRELVTRLPFCDFGAVIDPPSPDVTAHVLEMLAGEGLQGEPPARHALRFLGKTQNGDGSWSGRWGVNYVYGTAATVTAAVAAGVAPSDPRLERALAWLEAHQNRDGGWGEDIRSYTDPGYWGGHGPSTASQTAWALLALIAAGREAQPSVLGGVDFLVRTQTTEGTWDEPEFTGTGFPGDFSINYHLYRLVFPIQALGRYVHGHHARWGHADAPVRRRAVTDPGASE
jgi:squalene-hopene/tetraprenyl-beta-curcumene cyclase